MVDNIPLYIPLYIPYKYHVIIPTSSRHGDFNFWGSTRCGTIPKFGINMAATSILAWFFRKKIVKLNVI